jgi:hypothetical protein
MEQKSAVKNATNIGIFFAEEGTDGGATVQGTRRFRPRLPKNSISEMVIQKSTVSCAPHARVDRASRERYLSRSKVDKVDILSF